MCKYAWFVLLSLLLADASPAQIGGTGRDGPLAPRANFGLDTSKNGGVFHFTRIDIPAAVTVSIRGPNPAILLSQGSVKIAGGISVDGRSSSPGPGGFRGGVGSKYYFLPGEKGKGPGGGPGGYLYYNKGGCSSGGPGGHATAGKRQTVFRRWCWGRGIANGSALPFQLQGGSGGGGGCGYVGSGWGPWGPSGAAGGGALLILADGDILVSGTVTANGGDSWESKWQNAIRAAGPGAGGSILLRSMRSVVIESTATVRALGGYVLPYFYMGRFGGDGYVRLDCYAKPPIVRGKVEGKSLALELPYLAETIPPQVGKKFGLACAAVPEDIVAVFMSKGGANIPLPPFGVLRLDLANGFIFAGGIVVPKTGVDPIGTVVFPVHNNAKLVGLRLHVQAINLITASKRPRLTNDVVTTVIK